MRIPHAPRASSGLAALVASLALIAAAPNFASAQDASDDAALDALIKEVDDAKKGDEKPAEAKPDDAAKPEAARDEDASKPQEPSEKKPGEAARGDSKPAELDAKDKDLDALLESLGETTDEPAAQDERKPPGPPGGGDQDKDQGPGGDDEDQRKDQGPGEGGDRQPRLTDKEKALDEELEELSGRRRKRNRRDQEQGEGSGPMGELIKEMRDVEKRLGEPDTGEETRGKQQQLVKRMETLIEQIRQESQQQSRMMQRQTQQPGSKPGDQPSDLAGNNPDGAPNQRPRTPTDRRSLAGGKDAWGHLPPELRQEMENVAKEDSLPMSEELIRRYYLSVSRGKLNRGE